MPATTSLSRSVEGHRATPTTSATIVAWLLLAATDAIVWWGGSPALLKAIRACPVRLRRRERALAADDVLQALRHASVFALHRYHCLKHAAAATCLLRLFGHPASFVMGVTTHPFQSHAWVEYSGGAAGREQERHEGIEWAVIFRG